MSYLRLLKFARPSMIMPTTIRGASNRMFNDPFFSYDPFMSPPYFREIERQHFESMDEMMREFDQVFEALANPSYVDEKAIGENEDRKITDKASQKEESTDSKDKASAAPASTETTEAKVEAKTQKSSDKQLGNSSEVSKEASTNSSTQVQPAKRNIFYDGDLEFFSFLPKSRLVSHTYNRAEKLLDEVSSPQGKSETNMKKPALALEETDELLKANQDFSDFGLSTFGKSGAKISGTSYESSTIFKNGRAVTVTKHSTLNPDGTIRTEVNQEYVDDKGQKDTRKWVKEDDSYKERVQKMKGEAKQEIGQLQEDLYNYISFE